MKKLLFSSSVWMIILAMLMGCMAESKTTETDAPDRPNIVLLFADDQTYTAVHALGNEEIKTPNLDRLVQHGTTFTHAYNMGGVERCHLCGFPRHDDLGAFYLAS